MSGHNIMQPRKMIGRKNALAPFAASSNRDTINARNKIAMIVPIAKYTAKPRTIVSASASKGVSFQLSRTWSLPSTETDCQREGQETGHHRYHI